MANFDTAFLKVMGNEGGYIFNPVDPGGETYKGVSRKFFPKWAGWATLDSYKGKPNFPENLFADSVLHGHVKSFYKKEFWDKAMLDTVVSEEIAEEIFDTGVNQGMVTSIKYAQQALNLLNKNATLYKDVAVDGVIGSVTLGLINSYKNNTALLRTLNGLQFMKYVKICEVDPRQEIFFNGWLNRT